MGQTKNVAWTRVTVSQFQAIRKSRIDLGDGVTFLLGRNESGKSSTKDAIEWALTGRSRGLDKAGRGASKIVRDGEKGAGVEVEGVDRNGDRFTFGRYVSKSGSTRAMFWPGAWVSDGAGGEKAARLEGDEAAAALADVIGAPLSVLGAALSGDRLLLGDSTEQKETLLRLLDVQVADEVGGKVYTLDELDKAEASAREDRLGIKRALSELGDPEPPAVRPFTPAETLRDKLAEARKTLEGQVAGGSAAAGRLEGLEADSARLLGDVRRRFAVRQGELYSDVVARISAELDAARAELDAVRAEFSLESVDPPNEQAAARLEESVSRLRVEAETARAVASRVGAFVAGGVKSCVLSEGLACKTSAKAFKGELDGLETAAVNAEAELSRAVAELERIKTAKDKSEAVSRKRAALVLKIDELSAALDATTELKMIGEKIVRLRAEAGGDEIERARERVKKLEAELKSAEQYAADQAWYEKAAAKKQKLSAELAQAEALVLRLGPKGIRVAALADALGDWLERVNATTARLSGGRHVLEVSLDPWRLTVDGRDPALLSVSARFRVATAIQVAIAEIVGLGLVVVDAADVLDEGNMAAFAGESVQMVTSSGVKVVITATREPGRWPTFGRTYWLEGGVSAVVGAGERVGAGA